MGQCKVAGVELSEEAIVACLAEKNRFLSTVVKAGAVSDFRPAAVLIILICQEGEWQVLFIHRTENLPNHKGQVAFPGGGSESEDDSIESTALRETYEEIGISRNDIHILGRLESRNTNSGYLITPVIGTTTMPVGLKLQHDEVSRVFTIPLAWLANASNRENRPYQRQGRVEEVIYYQLYQGELLWGISAQIMVDFLRVLGF